MNEQLKNPLKESKEITENSKKDNFIKPWELQGKELEEEMEILDNLIRASKDMIIREKNNQRLDGYII